MGTASFARDTRQVPPLSAEDAARFWSRVQRREDGCWQWTGATGHNGYGTFYLRKPNPGTRRAHRITWTETHGFLPHGFDLDHAVCHNRWCVNPGHLELVTTRVNSWRGAGFRWSELMIPTLRRVIKHVKSGDLLTSPKVAELTGLSRWAVHEATVTGELVRDPSSSWDMNLYTRDAIIDFIINRAAEDSGAPVLRALITERTAA